MNLTSVVKKLASRTMVVAGVAVALPAADLALNELGFTSGAFISVAEAQAPAKKKTRRTPAMSEKMSKAFAKVSELASPPEESGKKPDLRAALAEVKKIEKGCKKCNQYELAYVYNFYGWLTYSLDDIPAAVKYYKKVIAQVPNIPIGLEAQALLTISQLSFQLENYNDSIKYHDKWMKLATLITSDAYSYRAQIYYQMKRKKDSLSNITRAIKMVEEKGKVPKEGNFNLQRALYVEKEDYKSATTNLIKVVRHFPKKSYWIQLSGLYGLLEKSQRQVHSMDTAYIMGGVTKEQQILNLAYLFIGQEYPFRAAKILSKAINEKKVKASEKNLELLARAWSQAKETKKAIPVMAKAAAKSEKGDLFAHLAGMYLDVDDSKNAISAGKKALNKGKMKRPGEVHIYMGQAYIDLKKYKSAVGAFKKAMEDKGTKRIASNWLKYAENELNRSEQLKKASG